LARAIAYRISIKDIVSGKYYPSIEEKQPNYVDVKGKKVTRVNIIGKVSDFYENPEKKYAAITIKEGENAIRAKFYDTSELNVKTGDFVKIIGKIKEDGQERFILGEIIKKVSPEYAELRRLKIEKEENKEGIVEDAGEIL